MENVTRVENPVSKLSMSHECPFCERINPPDAKFCNACGAPLHLLPCPRCGAVNDAAATTCHQCATALPAATTSEPPPSSSGGQPGRSGASADVGAPSPEAEAFDRDAKVFATLEELRQLLAQTESAAAERVPDRGNPAAHKPDADTAKAMGPLLGGAPSYPAPAVTLASEPQPVLRRVVLPRRGVVVAAAVLLAAALSYFASGHRPTAEVAQTPAAAGEVKRAAPAAEIGNPAGLGESAETASIPPAPIPVPTVTPGVAPSPQGSPPDGSIAPTPVTPPPTATIAPAQQANAARAEGIPQRDGKGAGVASSAAPAAAAGPRPRAAEAGTGIERPAPPQIGPCTDAVAALGLCTREPAQRRE